MTNANESLVPIRDFQLFVKTISPSKSSKKTTIFLHDSLGCTTLWRDFPQRYMALTGDDVVVYDRRGYGQSTPYPPDETRTIDYMAKEAEVLHELLDQLDIESCSLFGHSDGATIALLAAAQKPNRIQQVIIEGPHIYVESITREGVHAASVAYATTDLKQRLQKYHGDRTDAMVHAWTSTWLSDFYQQWNVTSQLPAITCPVLAFQGEADEFGTAQQVWDIQQHVSGECEVVLIPEIGHTPHKECPDFVLSHLEGYFGKG